MDGWIVMRECNWMDVIDWTRVWYVLMKINRNITARRKS